MPQLKTVKLNLPTKCTELFNNLYRSKQAKFLKQDLLAVRCPNDKWINVSFEPEFNPDGTYVVATFVGDWQNHVIELETQDIDAVITKVEELAVSS